MPLWLPGGTVEAFAAHGCCGILWANFLPTLPPRVTAFDPDAVPTTPDVLWPSQYPVIEADVLRTYGVIKPTTVEAEALDSEMTDAPLPKYASGARFCLPWELLRAEACVCGCVVVGVSVCACERVREREKERMRGDGT